MRAVRNVRDYHANAVHLLHKVVAGLPAQDPPLKIRATTRSHATMYTLQGRPLLLPNGGQVFVEEEIDIDGRTSEIRHLAYKFQYSDSGVSFRYERDMEASIGPDGRTRPEHPECHLHVGSYDIRFPTHATSFDEFLRFVVAVFLSPDQSPR